MVVFNSFTADAHVAVAVQAFAACQAAKARRAQLQSRAYAAITWPKVVGGVPITFVSCCARCKKNKESKVRLRASCHP